MKNTILLEDYEKIYEEYGFSELKGKSILITGATGLLGSQLIRFFDFLNNQKSYDMKIYALARNVKKVNEIFDDIKSDSNIMFFYGDVLQLPTITEDVDYIIHGASITSSKDFISKAVETIDIAVNGTLNMLRLAKDKNVKGFLYLSSMEAFGITDGKGEVREDNLGYIDISSPRSSYMESKRMCENLCACYSNEYDLDIKSIRLTQTIGVGIAYDDSRVAAYFARSVLEGNDIVLKTEGKTKRPILYSSDAISAILFVLLKGKRGEIYTAANPSTFNTIKETAEIIVEKIAQNQIKLKFDIKDIPREYAQNVNLNLNLNVDKLKSLGWNPQVGLEEAYRRYISGMKNSK